MALGRRFGFVLFLLVLVPASGFCQDSRSLAADLPTSLDVSGFAVRANLDSPTKACAAPAAKRPAASLPQKNTQYIDLVEFGLQARQIGGSLAILVRPGSHLQELILYSEPSHTLLGAIIDRAATSEQVSQWLQETKPRLSESQVRREDLTSDNVIFLDTGLQPGTDTRVDSHVRAFFSQKSGGVSSELQVVRASINRNNFAFTYRHFREENGDIDPLVTCGGGPGDPCPAVSGDCPDGNFACCTFNNGCTAWCGDHYICCGRGVTCDEPCI